MRRLSPPFFLLLAVASCTDPAPEEQLQTSADEQDIQVSDIMARAQQWVDLEVPYCPVEYGGTTEECGVCVRPHAAWDDYRTDCSGFVSWAWQITEFPNPDSAEYSVDRAGVNGWSTIAIDDLAAGDALTTNGHIKLFSRFVSANAVEILEEYNCGEVARRTVQSFTRTGNTIYIAGDDRPYHPIRRHSVTPPPPPGPELAAFQANTGELWTTLKGAMGLGMMHGTSPSVAVLANGGYEIAFQANTGDLWTTGTAGTHNWHQGMRAGTSPSIAAVGTGYVVAFQANTKELFTAGTVGTPAIRNWHLGMDGASSPSIATLSGGGYVIGFQANTHNGWFAHSATFAGSDAHLGMRAGTSPSMTALPNNGYIGAFQANTGELWTSNGVAAHRWGLGLDPASSPSIVATGSEYTVAFQSNAHGLWFATSSNYAGRDAHLGMKAGTSPALSHLDPHTAYFQANTGGVWSSKTGTLHLGLDNPTSPSGT